MNLEAGTLVLGKLAVRNRTNKRMDPLSILVDNVWESADRDVFESSLPLKIPNDLQAENNAPIISELTEAPKLSGKDPQRFHLTPVRQATVVIDRRASGPAHRVVDEIGEVPHPRWANSSTEIFVLCEGDLLLGPLHLVKRKPCAPSPAKLEVRRSDGMVVANFDDYLVGDRIGRLPVVDYVDCRPVNDVLDEVATLAVSTLTCLDFDVSHIQTTKQTLVKVRDWISDRASSSTNSLDSQRVQRALQACGDADTQLHLSSQIAATLTGLPAVAAQIERAIEGARANAERAELDEIANRVALKTELLAELDRETHAAQSELRQLNDRTAQAQHELITAQERVNSRNEELRGDVAVAVEELVKGTRERLASSIIAQALTTPITPASVPSLPAQVVRSSSPMSIALRPVAKTLLTEKAAIRKGLSTAAKASGMTGTAATRLFAAFSAGLLPITLGNGGPAALSAIAALMFSGRIARIPVAHDFLHPVDLLGLHSAKPDAFRNHHGVLEGANSEAAAGEVMIVLEGINQAPTESYLVPWLHSRWEDTAFASLQPHPNLGVAGTIATGITSARISPDLWGYAIAVDMPKLPTWSVGKEFSRVRLEEPTEYASSEVVGHLLTDVEPLWLFSDDIVSAAQRFAGALHALETEGQVQRSVAECILLPAGATSLAQGEYEAFVTSLAKNISLTEDAAESYHNLAKRLRMRLL